MSVELHREEQRQPVVAERRQWLRPCVQRISAGSAELGGTENPDAGVTFS